MYATAVYGRWTDTTGQGVDGERVVGRILPLALYHFRVVATRLCHCSACSHTRVEFTQLTGKKLPVSLMCF